jgi:hypothetical protein
MGSTSPNAVGTQWVRRHQLCTAEQRGQASLRQASGKVVTEQAEGERAARLSLSDHHTPLAT